MDTVKLNPSIYAFALNSVLFYTTLIFQMLLTMLAHTNVNVIMRVCLQCSGFQKGGSNVHNQPRIAGLISEICYS